MNIQHQQAPRINTACILAAGTGSRLHPLTKQIPKCLTEVHGRSILERLICSLRDQGFKRLVFVVGHLEERIRDFLELHAADLTIEFVTNPVFATTNNIYSLWLVRHYFKEPFLLVESDLVFETSLLASMSYPDRIAISHRLPWMNGTTVFMEETQRVSEFCMGGAPDACENSYKTVNICSLSSDSWRSIVARLDKYICAGRVNEYYETVFSDLVAEGELDFECVLFDESRWYEVDTIDDLRGACEIFADETHSTPSICQGAAPWVRTTKATSSSAAIKFRTPSPIDGSCPA